MTFLIFDIDGTLTNTMSVEDKCFFRAFELTFGLDIANRNWADFQNVTDWSITEEIMEQHFNRLPSTIEYNSLIDTFITLLKAEMSKNKEQFSEVPGAADLLVMLNNQPEFGIGFATGCWSHSARMKLENVGINPDQYAFANSDHHRTREGITQYAISQLQQQTGQSPEKIIYFGDGVWDFKTCQNLGIPFIGIDVNGNGKLEALGAEVVFRDFLDQEAVLEAVKGSR